VTTPRWMRQRTISIGTWLTAIFLGVVLIAVVAVQGAIRYQEDISVRAMAEAQARRAADLVFQNLYAVMSRGGTRDDLLDVIDRIRAVDPVMDIAVRRGAAVAEQFGASPADRQARLNDSAVAQAFATGQEVFQRNGDIIRLVYPVVTDRTCGTCHAVGGPGTVNGVIDMRFPVGDLRLPLQFTLRLALYALMATLAVLFLVIFLQMRLLIVRPIVDLAGVIRAIMSSDDLTRRVAIRRFWPRELRQLAISFNGLMQEVEESRAELVERSLRDPLTGLFNRRRFDSALAREVARAGRYDRPLSVLLIDLDGFKAVNDTHGHAAGDRVLAHVSRLLRASVRGSDVVARIGGDEFAILLPETDQTAADEVAAKLEALIAEEPCAWTALDLRVGASIGVAATTGDSLTANGLMAAADAAMYARKAARKAAARDQGPPAEDAR